MKKLNLFLFIFILILIPVFITFAQENKVPRIPEGFEEVQLGGSAKLIVPKGAKLRKVGAQIIVEGIREYTARRISQIDEQLAGFEQRQTEMQQQLNMISETIKEIQDSATPTNEKSATIVK